MFLHVRYGHFANVIGLFFGQPSDLFLTLRHVARKPSLYSAVELPHCILWNGLAHKVGPTKVMALSTSCNWSPAKAITYQPTYSRWNGAHIVGWQKRRVHDLPFWARSCTSTRNQHRHIVGAMHWSRALGNRNLMNHNHACFSRVFPCIHWVFRCPISLWWFWWVTYVGISDRRLGLLSFFLHPWKKKPRTSALWMNANGI